MLLMLFWTVVAARQREDQRITSLKLTELARSVRVIGQLVVGKSTARYDVRAHTWTPSMGELGAALVDGGSDPGGGAKNTSTVHRRSASMDSAEIRKAASVR